MKTTMQELIKTLGEMVEHGGDDDLLPAIEHAKGLLDKEKQQIIDAVEWNYKSNMGEVYYKAKFSERQDEK